MSITSANSSKGIPRLFDRSPTPAPSQAKRFWEYVHRWRVNLFHLWGQDSCGNIQPADLELLVDQFLGMSLLLNYVKRWKHVDTTSLQLLCEGSSPTAADLCMAIQKALPSPILQSVFDPAWVPTNARIPVVIFNSGFENRIADALWLLLRDNQIPLSLFGDFHQLCVANPLGTSKSQRYERGIHYTPAPIVDYLVNTVLNRVLAGRSVDEVRKLHILDPSCGCGAFLIAALRYVFRWLEEHSDTTTACQKCPVQERLNVLGEMFFGIDIDERAVTWTIRLLLLAVWEASLADTAQPSPVCLLRLPDLRKNIICHSFLDIPNDSPHSCVDAIIGGPPFVRLRQLHRSQPQQISAYRRQFRSARRGQFDLYMLFIEQALNVLADRGGLGFSVSNSFICALSAGSIRRIIAQQSRVVEIVEFEDKEVYPEAVTQIALLSLAKGRKMGLSRHVLIKGVGPIREKLDDLFHGGSGSGRDYVVHEMPSHSFDWPDWHLLSHKDAAWLAAIHFMGRPIVDFLVGIGQGLNTGADDVFLMREVGRTFKHVVFGRSRLDGKTYRLEGEATRPIIRGRHIKGYRDPVSQDLCIYSYDSTGHIFSEEVFQKDFPWTYHYLLCHQSLLLKRPMSDSLPWYATALRNSDLLKSGPKLVCSKISSPASFTFIDDPITVCHNSIVVMIPDASKIEPYCLLAILNSSTFWRFVRLTTPYMGCTRQVLRLSDVKRFPIPWPMTVEQKQLCEVIEGFARQARYGAETQAVQAKIDAWVNILYKTND